MPILSCTTKTRLFELVAREIEVDTMAMMMDSPPATPVAPQYQEAKAATSRKSNLDYSKFEVLYSADEKSFYGSMGKAVPDRGRPSDGASRENIRVDSVREAGYSSGARAGLNWKTQLINKGLELVGRNLDLVYDFAPLMIEKRVTPPVLTEARDVMTQEGDDAVLLNGQTYKIVSQAKFSSRPPHWRSYLWRTYANDSLLPDPELLPRNAEEKEVWGVAVQEGWAKGVEQANEIFDSSLIRMDRDYRGMIRYHMLAMQNMVTIPVVAEAKLPINATGQAMDLDGQIFRLTAVPQFNGERQNWRPLILEKQKLEQPNDSLRDGPKPVVLWDSRLAKAGKPTVCSMCAGDEKGEERTTTKLNASGVMRQSLRSTEPPPQIPSPVTTAPTPSQSSNPIAPAEATTGFGHSVSPQAVSAKDERVEASGDSGGSANREAQIPANREEQTKQQLTDITGFGGV